MFLPTCTFCLVWMIVAHSLSKATLQYSRNSLRTFAVRKVGQMSATTPQASSELRDFLAVHMSKAGCAAHDLDHCYRVAYLACSLAQEDGFVGNVNQLFVAGLLHDVFDSKLYNPDQLVEVEQTLRENLAAKDHFSGKEIDDIFQTVRAVGYKNMLIPNRDISGLPAMYKYVQDSDLLDAIGAIGVARCLAYSGKINRKIGPPRKEDVISDLEAAGISGMMDRSAYLASQTASDAAATDHFHEKLLRIPGMMITGPGRRMAAKRNVYMKQFLEQFREEMGESGF